MTKIDSKTLSDAAMTQEQWDDSTEMQASFSVLLKQTKDMETKAGRDKSVDSEDIEKLQKAVDAWQATHKDKVDTKNVQKAKEALAALGTIVAENKNDGSNDARWERQTVAFDNLLMEMYPTSEKNKGYGYKNDFDATVQAGLEHQPGDAAVSKDTAQKLQNYLNAHQEALDPTFASNVQKAIALIGSGGTVTKQQLVDMGATEIVSDNDSASGARTDQGIANAVKNLGSAIAKNAGQSTSSGTEQSSKTGGETTTSKDGLGAGEPAGDSGKVYTGAQTSALPGDLKGFNGTVRSYPEAKPPIFMASVGSPPEYQMYSGKGQVYARGSIFKSGEAFDLNNGNYLILGDEGADKNTLTNDASKIAAGALLRKLGTDAENGGVGTLTKVDNPNLKAPEGAVNGSQGNGNVDKAGAGVGFSNSNVKLPGVLNDLQKTQQVNFLADANPPIYFVQRKGEENYRLYDAQGKPYDSNETFSPLPQAIGLNNGKWLVLNEGGIQNSALVDDATTLPENTITRTLPNADKAKSGTPKTEMSDVKGNGVKTEDARLNKAFAYEADGETPRTMNPSNPKFRDAYTEDPHGNKRKTYWAGANTASGKDVFVNVYLPQKDSDTLMKDKEKVEGKKITTYIEIKDEKGNIIDTPDINVADPQNRAKFTYKDGPEFFVTKDGYFLVNQGLVLDVLTGKEAIGKDKKHLTPQQVQESYDQSPGKDLTQQQK